MAFTSAAFVGLTALAVALYYALPKRAQWCVLLLASLTFYLAGGMKSIVWLVLIILITWTAGLLLGRQNAKTPADKAEKAAIPAPQENHLNFLHNFLFWPAFCDEILEFHAGAAALGAGFAHPALGFPRAARAVFFHFPVDELRHRCLQKQAKM